MSGRFSHDSDQKLIPAGFVLLMVGFIILGTVMVIWVMVPTMMPQPVYDVVSKVLPITAVPSRTSITAQHNDEQSLALLPESPDQIGVNQASSAISSDSIIRRDPTAGEPLRIYIPGINLDAPVGKISLEKIVTDEQVYYQWPVLNEFKAGWHDNSARLGDSGNTVLNGHHNIYGSVFGNLIDLDEGDKIILYDAREAYQYLVTKKEILAEQDQPMSVRIENAKWIAPTEDERITLVTCWPYTDNSHRLVIVAKPFNDT